MCHLGLFAGCIGLKLLSSVIKKIKHVLLNPTSVDIVLLCEHNQSRFDLGPIDTSALVTCGSKITYLFGNAAERTRNRPEKLHAACAIWLHHIHLRDRCVVLFQNGNVIKA